MKIPASLALAALASGLIACSQVAPLPSDHIAANIAPILQIERRSQRALNVIEMLTGAEVMTPETLKKIKKHQDIYFVHHIASTVYLASGDLNSYRAHIQLAESELDAMEELLKGIIVKNTDMEISQASASPEFEL